MASGSHCLLPVAAKAVKPSAGEILLDLGASASLKPMRWLRAILSPRPGWTADGGGFPLWAASCSGHVRFGLAARRRAGESRPSLEKQPGYWQGSCGRKLYVTVGGSTDYC